MDYYIIETAKFMGGIVLLLLGVAVCCLVAAFGLYFIERIIGRVKGLVRLYQWRRAYEELHGPAGAVPKRVMEECDDLRKVLQTVAGATTDLDGRGVAQVALDRNYAKEPRAVFERDALRKAVLTLQCFFHEGTPLGDLVSAALDKDYCPKKVFTPPHTRR